ncbi:hypothetical protein [Aeribacillus sp. FSL K6-2833]|uniref:hypothetical protein n=1 Tax=Aeribacillus sp. FSL K6-2833 TaxID=2954611 RepID=UPI0030DDDDB8
MTHPLQNLLYFSADLYGKLLGAVIKKGGVSMLGNVCGSDSGFVKSAFAGSGKKSF